MTARDRSGSSSNRAAKVRSSRVVSGTHAGSRVPSRKPLRATGNSTTASGFPLSLPVAQWRREIRRAGLQQGGRRAGLERLEAELRHARLRERLLRLPTDRHQQDERVDLEPPGDKGEHLGRRLVEPVQVLGYHKCGRIARNPAQQVQRRQRHQDRVSELHQLLRPVLAHLEELPAPQAEALMAAFGISAQSAPDRFLIALAALDLLADAASAVPRLLLVEDAHWLDQGSADVLAFVGRRLGEADRFGLLVAIRDGFDSPSLAAGLPELRLSRLDDDAAGALLDARAGDLTPDRRARILEDAAGNPLALAELPTALARLGDGALPPRWLPLTTRLEQAFTVRMTDLPDATRAALLVAALEDTGSLRVVLDAADVMTGGQAGLDDLTSAVSAALVEVNEASVRFRHRLVRSAVRSAASPAARQRAHAALGAALEDFPDRSIWHRAAAAIDPDEALAAELEASAGRARRRGGTIAALERAARLSPDAANRTGRLMRAAELAFELGIRDLVVRLLAEAETPELSPLDRSRAAWIRESFDDGVADAAAGAARLTEIAEQTAERGDPGLAIDLLGGAALRCW
jgi:hypothetical protein